MPQRLLNLTGEQLAVVAEVTFERVAVDHDSVLVAFRRDPVAEVLAVGMALGAEIGDDHRNLFQHPLEFLREGVNRVGDKGFELIGLGLIHCPHVNPHRLGAMHMKDHPTRKKLRTIGSLFALLAIVAGGVVWSGCGSSSNVESSTNQAKKEVEEGTKKAEEAAKEGAETAKKGLEKATEQTKKGFEEAKEQIKNAGGSKQFEKARKEAEKGVEEGSAQAEKGLEEAKEQAEKYAP